MSTMQYINTGFETLPFSVIVRDDESNMRTYYDREALDELKASIREHGINQNMGVLPVDDDLYTVIWGFRRHKATEELLNDLEAEGTEEAMLLRQRLFLLPVKILSGDEAKRAKELQIIENLQREGVDPVDEARGYRKLLDEKNEKGEAVYSIERLAEVLGVPRKGTDYIRMRLKLLQAPDILLDAIRSGVVQSVRVGELIGKIANEKMRLEAAKRAIADKYTGQPMTTRQVVAMIEQDYNVTLRGAEFDLDATDLLTDQEKVEYGFTGCAGEKNDGSCERCLLRSGNDPMLEGLLSKSEGAGGGRDAITGKSKGVDTMICQNPPCHDKKQSAAWLMIEKAAEASGMRVMSKDRAKALYPYGYLNDTAKYVERDARPDYSCTGHLAEETMPTWEELLSGANVSWILVRAPNRKIHHILEKEIAITTVEKLCAKAGKPNPFLNRPAKGSKATGAATTIDDDDDEDADLDDDVDADTDTTAELELEYEDVSKPMPKAKTAAEKRAEEAEKKAKAELEERERQAEYKFKRILFGSLIDKLKAPQVSAEMWRGMILELNESDMCDADTMGAGLGLWLDPIPDGAAYTEHRTRNDMYKEQIRTMPITERSGFAIFMCSLASQMVEYQGIDEKFVKALCDVAEVDQAALRERLFQPQNPNDVEAELPLPLSKPLPTRDELVKGIIDMAARVGHEDEEGARDWLRRLMDREWTGENEDDVDYLDPAETWGQLKKLHDLAANEIGRLFSSADNENEEEGAEPDLFNDKGAGAEELNEAPDWATAEGVDVKLAQEQVVNEAVHARVVELRDKIRKAAQGKLNPADDDAIQEFLKAELMGLHPTMPVIDFREASLETLKVLLPLMEKKGMQGLNKTVAKKAVKKSAKKTAAKKVTKKCVLSPETKQAIKAAQEKRWGNKKPAAKKAAKVAAKKSAKKGKK